MKIECISVDDKFQKDFKCFRPQGLAEWNLFVLFKSYTYVFQNNDYVLAEPGTYCIFKKGVHTEYYPRTTPFVHDFFHFNYDEENEKCYFQNLSFGTLSGLRNQSEIENIIKMMKSELDFDNLRDISALNELGRYFFIKLAENSYTEINSSKNDTRYANFMVLRKKIMNKPECEWKSSQLAQNMFISESYFQHFYKKLFGISFLKDVIEARIVKAKGLLLYSNYSVVEVAEICGYSNVEHFIRQFKKSVGIPPHRYRKSMMRQ